MKYLRTKIFKLPLLLITALFAFTSVAQKRDQKTDKGYVIKGKIKGLTCKKIGLTTGWGADHMPVTDSATVKKGAFVFKGTVAYPTSMVLKSADSKFSLILYVENSNITVTGDVGVSKEGKVTGSTSNDEYVSLNESYASLKERSTPLFLELLELRKTYPDSAAERRKRELDPLYDEILRKKVEFIKHNPQSYVSLMTLTEIYRVLDDKELGSLFYALAEPVRQSPGGVTLEVKVKGRLATQKGIPAPQFTQNDADGNPVSLSSFKGQYVLIDFWASWCGPCRKENPNLIKAYQEFKDKGLKIIGISLDDNKEKWIKAIEKDGLPWVHVSDLQGWKNAVALQYGVDAVPANFLVSPEGNIIASNLRGEALKQKLAEILP